ncbi:hypothetical protein NKR23_g4030 [Pleurostoma richardsiae]|uniref:Uncharacterized protein n=1 Tax=Pleurostoma richardsiae TaxID=41990 RepID=A0AA38VL04_9PEZI|nr:hypothetical protein NKR23_g4030 [Pleurostoma richardsiae]
MSGSGGFYKYRCKYFYTHNCPEWVWVNNSACPACLAKGRDSVESEPVAPVWRTRDIFVPMIQDGTLQYMLMEIVSTGESGNEWTLRHKVHHQPSMPAIPTTSDTPRAIFSSTGLPTQIGF